MKWHHQILATSSALSTPNCFLTMAASYCSLHLIILPLTISCIKIRLTYWNCFSSSTSIWSKGDIKLPEDKKKNIGILPFWKNPKATLVDINIVILLLWKYLKGSYACLSPSLRGQIDSKQGTQENKKKSKNRDSMVPEISCLPSFLSYIKAYSMPTYFPF